MIGSERTTCVPTTCAINRTARIRALNEALRRYAHSGVLCITAGIQSLGQEKIEAVLLAVRHYDRFDDGNDPYAEHDFGALTVAGACLLEDRLL